MREVENVYGSSAAKRVHRRGGGEGVVTEQAGTAISFGNSVDYFLYQASAQFTMTGWLKSPLYKCLLVP